jgi:hypothetical protein
MLGGLSILVWVVMFGTQGFRAAWAIDQHFKNLTFTTASLSLIVNYPHFLISYKLAYSRGRAFVTAHYWQLIVVPPPVATFHGPAVPCRSRSCRWCRCCRAHPGSGTTPASSPAAPP